MGDFEGRERWGGLHLFLDDEALGAGAVLAAALEGAAQRGRQHLPSTQKHSAARVSLRRAAPPMCLKQLEAAGLAHICGPSMCRVDLGTHQFGLQIAEQPAT